MMEDIQRWLSDPRSFALGFGTGAVSTALLLEFVIDFSLQSAVMVLLVGYIAWILYQDVVQSDEETYESDVAGGEEA